MNTKEQGDVLENFVKNNLNVNKTRGSGASKHDGDLKDKDNYIIECKQRSQDSLSIPKKWLDTIKKQAELSDREWIIASQLNDKQVYITISFESFKIF